MQSGIGNGAQFPPPLPHAKKYDKALMGRPGLTRGSSMLLVRIRGSASATIALAPPPAAVYTAARLTNAGRL